MSVEETGPTAQQCPICLEEVQRSDLTLFQNCSHFICKLCETDFLPTSNRCPVCRIPIQDENVVIRSCLERINSLCDMVLTETNKLRTVDARNRLTSILNRQNTDNSNEIDELRNLITDSRTVFARVVTGAAETGLFPVSSPQTMEPQRRIREPMETMLTPLINTLASMHSVPAMMMPNDDNRSNFSAVLSVTGHEGVGSQRRNPTFIDNIRNLVSNLNR